MTLLEMLKAKGLKPVDVAIRLDCPTSNIYIWNKYGISQFNPHYDALKEIFPELEPKDPQAKGTKRKKRTIKQIKFDGPEIQRITQPKKVNTRPEYPTVKFKKKD